MPLDELISYAKQQKDPNKATCIEAIEFASKQNPGITDEFVFNFAIESLSEKAARIKWESAKVIGNTAHLFPELLEQAISELIKNSAHDGTVVRWSAAFALGEIVKMKSKYNQALIPQIEIICNKEEKNSIRKMYLDAIKKASK